MGLRSRLIFGLWLTCLSLGCSFDGDTEYYPVTQAAYLMITPESATQANIVAVSESGGILSWEQQWSSEPLHDMQGEGNSLWLSMGQELLEIDLAEGALRRRIPITELSPHFLCLGREQLLIGDTVSNQIAFLSLKTEKLILRQLSDTLSGQAAYLAQVFYLGIDSMQVLPYHETAFAPLSKVQLPAPLVKMSRDYIQSVACLTQASGDSTLSISLIDANTRLLVGPARATNWEKIQYSPYPVANLGKEYTGPARLRNRQVAPSAFALVDDYEFDFFEATYYYLAQDSLFQYGVRSQQRKGITAVKGQFQSAFFHIAPLSP